MLAEPPSQRAPWAPLRTPLPGPQAGLRPLIRVHLRAAPRARRSFDNVVAALRADHKSPPFEWAGARAPCRSADSLLPRCPRSGVDEQWLARAARFGIAPIIADGCRSSDRDIPGSCPRAVPRTRSSADPFLD